MTEQRIKLTRTCWACPEQYDAFFEVDGKEQPVGYLRLRHGNFTVCCPGVGGDIVYRANPDGDGTFSTAEERHRFLNAACKAILQWLEDNKGTYYYVTNADKYQDPWYDFIVPPEPKPEHPDDEPETPA